MVNENLTFGGYPLTFEKKDGEVYITCKGLTGTIKQVNEFFRNKSNSKYYFWSAKIRNFPNKRVKINCLEDFRE